MSDDRIRDRWQYSPNSTWLLTCRASAFGLCRAYRTARRDTLVSTCSTCRTCRVVSRRDVTSQVEFGLISLRDCRLACFHILSVNFLLLADYSVATLDGNVTITIRISTNSTTTCLERISLDTYDMWQYLNTSIHYFVLYSSRVRVSIRVRIRFSVWLLSCYVHAFILVSIVTLPARQPSG